MYCVKRDICLKLQILKAIHCLSPHQTRALKRWCFPRSNALFSRIHTEVHAQTTWHLFLPKKIYSSSAMLKCTHVCILSVFFTLIWYLWHRSLIHVTDGKLLVLNVQNSTLLGKPKFQLFDIAKGRRCVTVTLWDGLVCLIRLESNGHYM